MELSVRDDSTIFSIKILICAYFSYLQMNSVNFFEVVRCESKQFENLKYAPYISCRCIHILRSFFLHFTCNLHYQQQKYI